MKRARSFSGREKQKWTPAKDAKEGKSILNRKYTFNDASGIFSVILLTDFYCSFRFYSKELLLSNFMR